VLDPDLLGDSGELVRVEADDHEAEPGGDGPVDVVGGAIQRP
jgi:hypothetical protein